MGRGMFETVRRLQLFEIEIEYSTHLLSCFDAWFLAQQGFRDSLIILVFGAKTRYRGSSVIKQWKRSGPRDLLAPNASTLTSLGIGNVGGGGGATRPASSVHQKACVEEKQRLCRFSWPKHHTAR